MRRLTALTLAILTATGILSAGPASATTTLPVRWGLTAGTVAGLADWNGSPPGANDWTCRPTAAHPAPVVLVPSTFTSITFDYNALAPYLHNQGYCVFALNYGQNPYIWPGLVGLGSTKDAAHDLSQFVDRVLTATGTSTVDIVGHSQGGILSRYYTQVLGGAAKVGTLITLGSPYSVDQGSNYLAVLYRAVHLLPNADTVIQQLAAATTPGLVGLADSGFWAELNAGGGISPSTHYLSLGSRADTIPTEALTYPQAPNTATQFVQDYCALDAVGHFGLPHDPNVVALITNGLDPAHATHPNCQIVGPSI